MNRIEKWDIVLQNHKYPCFFAELVSGEILFANQELTKLFSSETDILGKKYYQLLANETAAPPWDLENIYQLEIFSKLLNQGFYATLTVLHTEGDSVIFAQLKPTNTKEYNNYSFEANMTQCISVLQMEEKEKVSALLQILGKFYNADKACLYLINNDKTEISCASYWTKDPSIKVVGNLSQHINLDVMYQWFNTRNEVGILDTDKNNSSFTHDSLEGTILNSFHLEDVVISVVDDSHGEPLGIIVVSNRVDKVADYRLLLAVTRFLEKDITKIEEKTSLEDLNDRDILTGFLNRSCYANKVDELLDHTPKKLGVFLANVNGLKKINTEFGYARGDSYIKKAAEVIRTHFDATIYRVAGDEFVAFFPDIEKSDFENKIHALRDKLKSDHNHLFALGHAWDEGRFECGHLISDADTMMYINKQEYYHTSNRRFDEIADSTLSDLLSFLDDGEFMIYLQPQVRLKDGSLYGAEALIRRFDKKNQKMVFPDQFISLYEKKSVIRHIDIFVVESVCKLLSQWAKVGRSIPISVNLSRVTLQEYGIVDTIVEICDRYNVPHHLVVIEVTERVGLIENNVASTLIQLFKDNGFNISLDDFGCAYSNIVTLAQIEVDEVKIDKSLVDDLTTSKKNHILVKNVLSMCNELEGASTLAEGIEDAEQAKLLHELGCHLGQGYFYSRPIPVDEFCATYIKTDQ